MPARLAITLTVYAVTPSKAFSRYQPTNCPKGTNIIAITANNGTMTAKARNMPGQLVGPAGTPQMCTSVPLPNISGSAEIIWRRGESGTVRIAVRTRMGAIRAMSCTRRRLR